MHRAISSLSRRLATTITIPPARLSPPLPLCLCRVSYTSSSSSGNNNNNNDDSSSTRPPPPRLLTHSSPLDLMSNLSLADSPSQPAGSTTSNPQSTILDQLGVKLDPTAVLASVARWHERHASGGKPPKRRSDAPFNRTAPPPPRRSGRGDGGNDKDKDSAGFVSLASSGDSPTRPRTRPPRPHSSPSTPSSSSSSEHPRSLDRWDPLKKLPRSTMDRLRFLHAQDPKTFSVGALSTAYGIGYESVKRILRSKFVPEADRAREMDVRRAALKDEWRAKRAREVRGRLASERAEREREVEEAKRNKGKQEEEEGVREVKKPGGGDKKVVVVKADVKDGGDGWDWLADKRAGGKSNE